MKTVNVIAVRVRNTRHMLILLKEKQSVCFKKHINPNCSFNRHVHLTSVFSVLLRLVEKCLQIHSKLLAIDTAMNGSAFVHCPVI